MNIHDRIIVYGILIPALIIFKTLLQKLTIDRKTKVCPSFSYRRFYLFVLVVVCGYHTYSGTFFDLYRNTLCFTINGTS